MSHVTLAQGVDATGPGCRSCPLSNVRYKWSVQATQLVTIRLDTHGRPLESELRRQDALGRTIHREHALYVAGKLQTPDWTQDLAYSGDQFAPDHVSTPSAVPGQMHELILTHNKAGQPIEIEERGWSPAGNDPLTPWQAVPTPIERRLRLDYDAEGRPIRLRGPRADIDDSIELSYDPIGRLQCIHYPDGSEQEVLAYDALGLPSKLRQSGQLILQLTHDAAGNLLTVTEMGVDDPRSVAYVYDARGRLHEWRLPDGHNIQMDYDAADRPTGYRDESSGIGTALTYADNDQLSEQQLRSRNGQVVRTLLYSYDAQHRLTALHDGHGRMLAGYGYDEHEDAQHNKQPSHLIDPLGLQTLLSYDRFGRVNREQAADGGVTQLAYDPSGRLDQVSTANEALTRYQYDDFGQQVREESPDRGSIRYFYDSAGNLTGKVDARGTTVHYGYDAGHRLTSIRSRDGTTNLEYTQGRLTRIAGSWGEERYAFDQRGRLLDHTRRIGARSFTTGYRYNSAGRVSESRLPDGQRLRYHYDTQGTLQAIAQVRWWGGESTLVSFPNDHAPNEQADAHAGGKTKSSLDSAGIFAMSAESILSGDLVYRNGLTTRTQLDADTGRIVSLATPGVETLEYRYDITGHVSDIEAAQASNSKSTSSQLRYHYAYDAVGRLTAADTPLGTFGYTYDANGNRQSAAHNGQSVAYRYTEHSNRLASVGDLVYRYDPAGNPLSIGTRQYEYDAEGRPIRLLVNATLAAQYVYNDWGERIQKVIYSGSQHRVIDYLYEDHRLTAEADEQGHITRQYLYLGYTPIAVLVGGDAYFIHADHLGAPRAVTDGDRQIVWRADYSPFGEVAPDEDPQHRGQAFALNLRLPGQYADQESETYYNYFRSYNPKIGRYMQSDPIGLLGGLNTYAYVRGNPITWSDQFGLKPGDSFPNAEAAAVDALNYINTKLYCATNEYAGWVYQEWSLFGSPSYTYDEPTELSPMGGTMPPLPTWHILNAMYHTHPPVPGADSNNYSPQDKDAADLLNVPSYLEIPSGLINRYRPTPQSPRGGKVDTVGKTSCSCGQ